MEREKAIEILHSFTGKNLHDLAKDYGITIEAYNGKINKGWVGLIY